MANRFRENLNQNQRRPEDWLPPVGTVTVGAAVANATGGATVDAEARASLNALLAELRTLGIIDT